MAGRSRGRINRGGLDLSRFENLTLGDNDDEIVDAVATKRRGRRQIRREGTGPARREEIVDQEATASVPGPGMRISRVRRGRGRAPAAITNPVFNMTGPGSGQNIPPPPPVDNGAQNATARPPPEFPPEEIKRKGLEFCGFTLTRQNRVQPERNEIRFRYLYGVSSLAVSKLIRDLHTLLEEEHRIKKFNLKYFFLTLYWFKAYPRYIQIEGPWDVCPEIIAASVKLYGKTIRLLKEKKIKWFEDGEIDDDDIFMISVDGVHCKTGEVRKQPGSKWYSHKSHGAGLAYELGIAIRSNRLVWINGPFPASRHDVTIFRYGDGDENNPGSNLRAMIPRGKRAITDSGYKGEDGKTVSVTHQDDSDEVKEFKARAKSRHETFNGRIKAFAILATEFRHDISFHQMVMESVCIMVQYDLESGHELFEI